MKLEIKSYMSTDIEKIKAWQPKANEDVYFQLEIEVGEKETEGAHIFTLMISTPEGLEKYHKGNVKKAFIAHQRKYKGFAKNGLLIVEDYTWEKIKKVVDEKVKECEKNSWDESLDCLRKNFFWEYEGIKYYR